MSKKDVIAELMTVLDEERAYAVEEFRRVTIKKPLTAYGAKRLALQLARWPDPHEAADIMVEKCWRGFNADWVRDRPKPNAPQSTGHAMLDALMVGRTH